MKQKKSLKVGDTVTGIMLSKIYGWYWKSLLPEGNGPAAYVRASSWSGRVPRYRVVRELPDLTAYEVMKQKAFTHPLHEVVSSAFGEAEAIKDELQGWYDNLPENFQNGDKGDELQNAVSELESYCEPTIPECLQDIPVFRIPLREVTSRSARLADCIAELQAVIEALDGYLKGEHTADEDGDALELKDELENTAQSWEGVGIPGMY